MKYPAERRDTCEVFSIDRDKVDKVRALMKADEIFVKLARMFKVLGDPTRNKIIYSLSREELCVCDISTLLGISQSAISHQLRILRNLNLVTFRKDGRIAYYSLDDDHIRNLVIEGLNHIEAKEHPSQITIAGRENG
jgi:ArsR family transcriptional regulator